MALERRWKARSFGLLLIFSLTACAGEPQQKQSQSMPVECPDSAPGSANGDASVSCRTETWRRKARAAIFVPEQDVIVSGLTAYTAETGERLWSERLRFTENVYGSNRTPDHLANLHKVGTRLQAFTVHDDVVLYADNMFAGTVDARTGEAISIIGLHGFEIAWDREVIQRGSVSYSADEAGVTVEGGSRSQLIEGARLLACDAHDLLVLFGRDGTAQALLKDGTREPMAPVPTPRRVHRLYSSNGVVKAAVADGTNIRADGVCWRATEEVGELIVTPFGVAGMEFDPMVEWKDHDDPMYLKRFGAVVFFSFPEKRDVAQCRWVTSVPRLVDIRPQ